MNRYGNEVHNLVWADVRSKGRVGGRIQGHDWSKIWFYVDDRVSGRTWDPIRNQVWRCLWRLSYESLR
jgi:hypothetical protein